MIYECPTHRESSRFFFFFFWYIIIAVPARSRRSHSRARFRLNESINQRFMKLFFFGSIWTSSMLSKKVNERRESIMRANEILSSLTCIIYKAMNNIFIMKVMRQLKTVPTLKLVYDVAGKRREQRRRESAKTKTLYKLWNRKSLNNCWTEPRTERRVKIVFKEKKRREIAEKSIPLVLIFPFHFGWHDDSSPFFYFFASSSFGVVQYGWRRFLARSLARFVPAVLFVRLVPVYIWMAMKSEIVEDLFKIMFRKFSKTKIIVFQNVNFMLNLLNSYDGSRRRRHRQQSPSDQQSRRNRKTHYHEKTETVRVRVSLFTQKFFKFSLSTMFEQVKTHFNCREYNECW